MLKASTVDRYIRLKIGKGYTTVELKRGEMVFGRGAAERELMMEGQGSNIYRTIMRFHEEKIITVFPNKQYSIIMVNDFIESQSVDEEEFEEMEEFEQPTNNQRQPTTGNEQPTNNQRTTNDTVLYSIDSIEYKEGKEDFFTEKQKNDFVDFKNWMRRECPNVEKMKEPLQIDEYYKLVERYGKIGTILKKMHNYVPLRKKNSSAYLTCINWKERELKDDK